MEKVSVVIPNYNGADLLLKNLPNVIKYCPHSEIIVVDDASTDNSVSVVHRKFRNKVKLVKLKKNSGFASAANTGVEKAHNEIVLLLNSDVSPRKNFLNPALKYFRDKSMFSVGLEDESHEQGRIIPKGRGGAKFRKGFVEHFAAVPERGITFWTSGGSALVNRSKLLKLGGFDTIYKPFYWEDIDLGFRAWRSGYRCYFEPLSKVDHFHEEGIILKTTSNFRIRVISHKNQFLFVWKNISDYYLSAMHILWLPYHLLRALIRMDAAFFLGLILAITSLPKLIMTITYDKYIISEKEIFSKFEK